MAKVSVIIPIYNAEKYLNSCLDSIVNQTLRDIEIICVDDGATDNSIQIIEEYMKDDNRIILLHQKNQGAGAARNYGMSVATGEFYSILDADDFFETEMLEKAYMACTKNNAEIAVFGADYFHNDTQKHEPLKTNIRYEYLPDKSTFEPKEIKNYFFEAFIWWSWDKLISADLVKRTGFKFQVQRTTNDLFFVAMVMLNANKITIVPDVLVHYRRDDKTTLSVTRGKSWFCFANALSAIQNNLKLNGQYDYYAKDFYSYVFHFTANNHMKVTGPAKDKIAKAFAHLWYEQFELENCLEKDVRRQKDYKYCMKLIKKVQKEDEDLLNYRKSITYRIRRKLKKLHK